MATLNTLRTRFGFVLTGVIALVLLAFIFSPNDFLSFSGSDPVVAKINGHDVTYSEYANAYSDVQTMSGVTEITDQQADMLYQSTWQALISDHIFKPGLEQMGMTFGSSEYSAVLRGELPTQTMYSAFGNPQTGAYDLNALNSFVMTSRGNAEAEAAWASLVDQAENERTTMKYVALVMSGINANSLECEIGLNGDNKSYSGRWAAKNYTDIEDGSITVSEAEVKSLYESRKELFKREPTRAISYVTVDVAPSPADKAAIETRANELAVGLFNTPAEDVRKYMRENRGSISTVYLGESKLPAAEAETLVKGEIYGPSRASNSEYWRISCVASSLTAPDTLSLRHIVLQYTDEALADSLLLALNNGGDFAEAARQYSRYTETAQLGGEIGEVPFSEFEDDFALPLAAASKGEVIKIAVGDMIQLVEVYDATPRATQYKLAYIEIPIIPSQTTRTAIHSAAGEFAVAATASSDKFADLAAAASFPVFKSELTPSTRSIDAVSGSYDVARWAHKAKVGDVSEIFTTDEGYVVAVLTEINDAEYSTLASVSDQLSLELMNKKKYEFIKSQVSGGSFDSKVASVGATSSKGDFDGVSYNSYYINGLGVEPAVIGAITSSEAGYVSAPIAGSIGVFFFEVDGVEDSATPQTIEAEKVNLEAMSQQMSQQMLFSVIESLGDITDLRGAVL